MMNHKKKSLVKNDHPKNQDVAGEEKESQSTLPAMQHKEKKAKDKNGKRNSSKKWDEPGTQNQQLEEAIG